MDIAELELIESEEDVVFSFKHTSKKIGVRGKPSDIDRAIKRIEDQRDAITALLIERQGMPDEEEVERELAFDVPSLTVHKPHYISWFKMKGSYYEPTPDQLDRMIAACEPGDELIFDYAHSFTVRKPNGLFVVVDRKGNVTPASPYSPGLRRI